MNLIFKHRLTFVRLSFVGLMTLCAAAETPAQDNLDLIDKVQLQRSKSVEVDLIDEFNVNERNFDVSTRKSVEPAAKLEYLPRPSTNEQKILETLNKQVEVILRDIDLPEAMNHLKETHGIEIWIDTVQLNGQEIKVSLETSKASLRSCLNLLLEPQGLCYFVEDDVLKVTTQDYADTKLITRTYPVDDLYDTPEEAAELAASLTSGLGLARKSDIPRSLIVSAKHGVVIARQSHRVHNELLQLLRDLRAPRLDAKSDLSEVAKH